MEQRDPNDASKAHTAAANVLFRRKLGRSGKERFFTMVLKKWWRGEGLDAFKRRK